MISAPLRECTEKSSMCVCLRLVKDKCKHHDWVVCFNVRTPRVKSKLIASYFFLHSFVCVFFFIHNFSFKFCLSNNTLFYFIFVVLCIQRILFILDIYRLWWNAFKLHTVWSFIIFLCRRIVCLYKHICNTTTFNEWIRFYSNVRLRSVFMRGFLSPDVCILCV